MRDRNLKGLKRFFSSLPRQENAESLIRRYFHRNFVTLVVVEDSCSFEYFVKVLTWTCIFSLLTLPPPSFRVRPISGVR